MQVTTILIMANLTIDRTTVPGAVTGRAPSPDLLRGVGVTTGAGGLGRPDAVGAGFLGAAAEILAGRLRGGATAAPAAPTPAAPDEQDEPAPASVPGAHLRPDEAFAKFTAEAIAGLPPAVRALVHHLPNIGAIDGAVGFADPAVIDSPEFGKSSATPAVLDIPVAPAQHGLLTVGKKAYEKIFADANYPPLQFNVNFSCADATGLARESAYTDPRSHWFNVFFGRYEIDARAGGPGDPNAWSRPFGFQRAGSTEIDFEDILRIGRADWGYFSNWMYGVPEAALDAIYGAPQPPPKFTVLNPKVQINGKDYVECQVEGVKLPSAYVSGKDGQHLVNNDPLMSPVWRIIFGRQAAAVAKDPKVAAKYPKSFVPTEMKMRFYLRYEMRNDDQGPTFATLIYGGGVNQTWAGGDPERLAFNDRFLEAQMAAVRATMK
jgi:hypothetical protein